MRTHHEAPHSGPVGGSSRIDRGTLEKIRGLLAKAESTQFPAEAESCTLKAQELMARYAIDAALLEQGSGRARAEPVRRKITLPAPYVDPKALLLGQIADANRCASVWFGPEQYALVVGYEVDLEVVELLFVSLLMQATTEMLAGGSRADAFGRSTTRSYRRSFLIGFAHRIGERLHEVTDDVVAEAAAGSASLVPVLGHRRDAVEAALDAAVPLRRERVFRASNGSGWDAGRVAADRADLGMTRLAPSAGPAAGSLGT